MGNHYENKIGQRFITKECGEVEVLNKYYGIDDTHTYYWVRFINTGYETFARGDVLKNGGSLYDPMLPRVYGVGCTSYDSRIYKIDYKLRGTWSKMIERCYDPNSEFYHLYGGAGVRVHPSWFGFYQFVNDCKTLPGYDKMIANPNIKFHLDKDILQQGVPPYMKIYSKWTCIFVPASSNSVQVAKDHFDNHTNIFFNVYGRSKGYSVEITVFNKVRHIGIFKDPIVAANAANHARRFYGLEILNTNVPYIPPEIVNSLNLKDKEQLCILK